MAQQEAEQAFGEGTSMALTPDDAKNINTALNALGRSLKDEIAKLPEKGRPGAIRRRFPEKNKRVLHVG